MRRLIAGASVIAVLIALESDAANPLPTPGLYQVPGLCQVPRLYQVGVRIRRPNVQHTAAPIERRQSIRPTRAEPQSRLRQPSATPNNPTLVTLPSRRVVENDAERVAVTGAHAAYTMAKIHPVYPSRSVHRAMVDREDYRVALAKRYDLRSRLHAWPLLGENELAARKISPRFGQ